MSNFCLCFGVKGKLLNSKKKPVCLVQHLKVLCVGFRGDLIAEMDNSINVFINV